MLHEKIHFSSTIDHIYEPLRDTLDNSDETPKQSQRTAELITTKNETLNLQNDSLIVADSSAIDDENSLEESEFMEEESEFSVDDNQPQEAVIIDENMIAKRRVKVHQITSAQDTLHPKMAEHLEVEQWETAIKNKHTYHFSGNTVRIKGLDISRVSIHAKGGQYYLEWDKNVYHIRPNSHYENLITTSLSE